ALEPGDNGCQLIHGKNLGVGFCFGSGHHARSPPSPGCEPFFDTGPHCRPRDFTRFTFTYSSLVMLSANCPDWNAAQRSPTASSMVRLGVQPSFAAIRFELTW